MAINMCGVTRGGTMKCSKIDGSAVQATLNLQNDIEMGKLYGV